MTATLHPTVATALATALNAQIGSGSIIDIRSGPPGGPSNPANGVLLWTTTIAGAWSQASNVLSTPDLPSSLPVAAGAAGHFRVRQGGTAILEGTITDMAGNGDIKLNTINLLTSVPVDIGVVTLTAPLTI